MKEPLENIATYFELESVIEKTLNRWTRIKINGQKLKECCLRAQIVRSADLQSVTAESGKWKKLQTDLGLEEMEGIYLLNRLKVMAFGWNRGNEIRSISECNHMELMYVLMEFILPTDKGARVKDQGTVHMMVMMTMMQNEDVFQCQCVSREVSEGTFYNVLNVFFCEIKQINCCIV